MISQKIFEDIITIDDPINFLSSNDDSNLLNYLKNKHEKKCFKKSYIVDITKILKHSDCVINMNLNCNANINVMFEANVLIYEKGDIISGASIVSIDNKVVLGVFEYGKFIIKISDFQNELNIFNKNQIIPLIIGDTYYHLDSININTVLYTHKYINELQPTTIFKIENKNATDWEPLEMLWNKIVKVFDNLKKVNKSEYDYFKNVFELFKEIPKNRITETNTEYKSFNDFKKNVNTAKYIKLFAGGGFAFINEKDVNKDSLIIEENEEKILTNLLYNIYNKYKLILDSLNIYNNKDIINKHDNIFRYIIKTKINE